MTDQTSHKKIIWCSVLRLKLFKISLDTPAFSCLIFFEKNIMKIFSSHTKMGLCEIEIFSVIRLFALFGLDDSQEPKKWAKYFFFIKRWLFCHNLSYLHLKFWIFWILKNFSPAWCNFFLHFETFFWYQFKNPSYLILLSFKMPSERFFHKDFKQMLLFEICGFKNCKIDCEAVNILVYANLVKIPMFTSALFLYWFCVLILNWGTRWGWLPVSRGSIAFFLSFGRYLSQISHRKLKIFISHSIILYAWE